MSRSVRYTWARVWVYTDACVSAWMLILLRKRREWLGLRRGNEEGRGGKRESSLWLFHEATLPALPGSLTPFLPLTSFALKQPPPTPTIPLPTRQITTSHYTAHRKPPIPRWTPFMDADVRTSRLQVPVQPNYRISAL